MIEDLEIIKIDLKAQRLKKLGPTEGIVGTDLKA